MSSVTDAHKTTLRQFMEQVWNHGDVDACSRFLAPAYTIHHDPGDPWDGQTLDVAGFKQRVAQSRAPFPDQRFDIQALVAEDDQVACAWRWTGTHRGPVGPFPPTGRVLTMSGLTIYAFSEGRIAGHWQVVDRLGVVQQLQAARPGGA